MVSKQVMYVLTKINDINVNTVEKEKSLWT